MRSQNPVISIMIPVFNGGSYLAEAIESALAQTYQPFEIIIVDDGSTDDSAETARSFIPRVRYCHQTNQGTAAARNKGIELARGDIFAFLDADDIWMPDKLDRQMAVIKANPAVDMVFVGVRQFVSPELDERSQARIHIPAEIMTGQIPSAVLVRRDSFLKVGLFETEWQVGAEVSWMLRAKEKGLVAEAVPDVLVMRRIHGKNKGITHRQFLDQRVRQIKASLDRRRKVAKPDSGEETEAES